MSKEELIQFLKDNLKVNISHAEHNVGYFSPYYEEDEHNFEVTVTLCGEVIHKSCSA